jgi:hypothetical protein
MVLKFFFEDKVGQHRSGSTLSYPQPFGWRVEGLI